jgi:hypothetical protein
MLKGRQGAGRGGIGKWGKREKERGNGENRISLSFREMFGVRDASLDTENRIREKAPFGRANCFPSVPIRGA